MLIGERAIGKSHRLLGDRDYLLETYISHFELMHYGVLLTLAVLLGC
jgi:hypothetical protein